MLIKEHPEETRFHMAKILVAMSGGVDSSLTAALLHEQGHDITGVTLHLWHAAHADALHESQCCSPDMVDGARRVCAHLGVPHFVFNYQREFRRHVVQYFIDGYAHGTTPNPCLVCNRDIKFGILLERARLLGFDGLATGHYVRIQHRDDGSYALWRGVDRARDQSYVLYMLQQHDLAHLFFPLGAMTKTEVRSMAHERNLVTASHAESQDICFIPNDDYRPFVRQHAPEAFTPGPIVDQEGREIGRHEGLPLYTVGQRRGLNLASSTTPRFVTALDVARNALVVGSAADVLQAGCVVEQPHFVSGQWPAQPFACQIQVRAHAPAVAGTVAPLHDDTGAPQRLQIQFEQPQRAITPGQAAVFYDAERVLGGGYIARP
jgi:tRNA-specific 2-thiouridylase